MAEKDYLGINIDKKGSTATVVVKHERGGLKLNDKFEMELPASLRKQSNESGVNYITRVREAFVKYTPGADSTSETLR